MKRFLWIIISVMASVLFLSACSSTEVQKAEEVYTKSAEATRSLESFAMDVTMDQTIKIEGASDAAAIQEIPIQSTIHSEIQMEPIAFHQTVETMGQTIEQYYSDQGFFMTMPGKEGWFKAPDELMNQINALSSKQQNPAEQLKSLEEYVDEFDLTTEDSTYILSFSSEGENVQKLMEDTLNKTLPEGMIPADILEKMNIQKLDYTFEIDKKSYYPQAMKIDMSISIEDKGQTLHLNQSVSGTYSKFNEIKEIEIPQEIIKNATEMNESGMLLQ